MGKAEKWTRWDKKVFQHLQDGCIIVKSKGEKEGYAVYTARSGKKLGAIGYHRMISVRKFQQYLDTKMIKPCNGYWAAGWNDQHPDIRVC